MRLNSISLHNPAYISGLPSHDCFMSRQRAHSHVSIQGGDGHLAKSPSAPSSKEPACVSHAHSTWQFGGWLLCSRTLLANCRRPGSGIKTRHLLHRTVKCEKSQTAFPGFAGAPRRPGRVVILVLKMHNHHVELQNC